MPTQYTTLKATEADRYAHSWAAYTQNGAVEIDSSDWISVPGVGLTISSEQVLGGVTSALITAATPGTYRVKNTVSFDDGAIGTEDIIFNVPPSSLASDSYITPDGAQERLWTRYGLKSAINPGDTANATIELDTRSTEFIGDRDDPQQVLAFPRSTTVAGDLPGVVPERVLDWIALRAHQISKPATPPAIKEQVDTLAVQYTHGKQDRVDILMQDLLRPYVNRWAGAVIV